MLFIRCSVYFAVLFSPSWSRALGFVARDSHLYSFITADEFPMTSSELRGRYFSVQGTLSSSCPTSSSSCLWSHSSWCDSSTCALCWRGPFLLSRFLIVAPCLNLIPHSDVLTISESSWFEQWRLGWRPSLWDSISCFLFPATVLTWTLLHSPLKEKQKQMLITLCLVFNLNFY